MILIFAATWTQALANEPTLGIAPDAALAAIVAGNKRFVAGTSTHAGASPKDRAELATGQHPHTMVLACADSRVAPELIFDQGLGELFVVRTAGNNIDEHGVASLEYANAHLGSRQLVILGHTSCGAVKAAIQTPWGVSAGSPALDDLVHDIQLCMGPLSPAQAADPTAREAVWANGLGARDALLAASPMLNDAVKSGHISVRVAVYDLESGQVVFEKSKTAAVAPASAPLAAAEHGH